MRNEKRKIWQLLLGILSLAGLFYIAYNYPPSLEIANLITTVGFFVLFSLCVWFFTKFALKNTLHANLTSAVITSYLIVRMVGLKHPFFLLLFIVLFITLYLFFKKQ